MTDMQSRSKGCPMNNLHEFVDAPLDNQARYSYKPRLL